ncbi:MAG: beta strand repeat-containing protein [Gloeotrichia echinulata DVL01]|nr:hypothetical protein [Gloeotrichia echinulata DEX184]
MSKKQKSLKKSSHIYRSLIATALLTNGIFQFVAPVLAEGTAAGQSISNTATATYEDPNSPGTQINATSNTVTVTVAEVAGITVTASGVVDNNGGAIQVGDLLIYTYTLTNVGNDPSQFRIPNLASTTGPGTVSGQLLPDKNNQTPNNGTLQYSTDGGTTWTNVSDGGVNTPSVTPGGTVLVRVPVTVQAGAQANDIIKVTLGNTPGDAQNQPRNPDGGDVYTVDNPDGSVGEVDGLPVNGTREASITQQIKVGSTPKNVALATILKTRTGYDNAATPSTLADDVITYGLSLKVESNDVTNNGLIPAPLTGTNINLDGSPVPVTRILLSDAIPAQTVINGTPTAPPGWKVVYSGDDPTSKTADQAQWQTDITKVTGAVRRIGFINDPTVLTTVSPGTTLTGFSLQIKTSGVTGTTATIVNIGQAFGQTLGDGTKTLVYDNSGDQFPDNVNPSTGQSNPLDSGYVPSTVDPTTIATDPGNNNSSTTPGGSANIYNLSAPNTVALLNGPNSTPEAIGPTNNNDDFTNKSALIPANTLPGSTIDPAVVAFTNTVQNTSSSGTAVNIYIVPVAPTKADDLPTNTLATITYGSISATYKYDGTKFVFQSGNGTVGGNPISGSNPIRIDAVAQNAKANYGVEVDLPPGTQLSTDINRGFPVPVTTFIDTNGNGTVDTTEAQNTTIDRVYTGFLQLVKVSRVLQGTGPAVGTGQDNFETTPAYTNPVTKIVIDPNPNQGDVARVPGPGNIIEYQIRYKNISDPQAGTGNIILNANKVVINEDGTAGGNNWAIDNDNNTQIDTSNIVGSAKDSGASTIQFFNGNPANTSGLDQTGTTVNTDVTKYLNSVTGTVAPGVQRTFTFQRKVN